MELSVIILNWNSRHFIKECLRSLLHTTQHLEKEIIIIDNGSKDGSVCFLEHFFPEIILIKNKVNKGVGPSRNQGIKIAKGEFILILDIDTIIHKNAIEFLLETIKTDQRIGIVGPKLVDKNDKLQFSCRFLPSIMSKAYRQLPGILQKWLLGREEMLNWPHDTLREVDYMIGACQLIRKGLIEDIGLFDARMFYGVEEVDYCLRTWKGGWKVVYNPAAVVTHIEQRKGRKNLFSRLQMEHNKSLLTYFLKYKYLFKIPKLH